MSSSKRHDPTLPPGDDDLVALYHQACALEQTPQPAPDLRVKVLQAAALRSRSEKPLLSEPAHQRPAANDARWKVQAAASVAVMGLIGLLAWQFLPHTSGYEELAKTVPMAPAPIPAAVPAPAETAPASAAPAAVGAAPNKQTARQTTSVEAKDATALNQTASRKNYADTKTLTREKTSTEAVQPAPEPVEEVPAAAAQQSLNAQAAPQRSATAEAESGWQAQTDASDQAGVPARARARVAAPAPAPFPESVQQPSAEVRAPAQGDEMAKPAAPAAQLSASPNLQLLAAAASGHVRAVQNALQQQANPNATDAAGRTALMLAARAGHAAVVKRLLAAGADAGRSDAQGLTAADHANHAGYPALAATLRENHD